MRSNQQIELARLVGFAAVVTLHGNALGLFIGNEAVGWVIDEACRFAVPVFFLISGYFWRPSTTQLSPYLRNLFAKLAIPFVFWAAVYIALDATEVLYAVPPNHSWRTYLTTPWTGSVAFHLWFLPALFVGTAIGLSLLKVAGTKKALAVAIALYLVGTLLGTYLRPLSVIVPLGVYRNGILFAPVFLIAGYALAQMPTLPKKPAFLFIALIGLALQLLEGYFVYNFYPRGHDMSLGTLLLAVGIFGFILNFRPTGAFVAGWGRDVFGGYLIHLLVLNTLIQYWAPLDNLALVFAMIAGVFVLSLVISRAAKSSRYGRLVMP